jgi:hypothetical protein
MLFQAIQAKIIKFGAMVDGNLVKIAGISYSAHITCNFWRQAH